MIFHNLIVCEKSEETTTDIWPAKTASVNEYWTLFTIVLGSAFHVQNGICNEQMSDNLEYKVEI